MTVFFGRISNSYRSLHSRAGKYSNIVSPKKKKKKKKKKKA